jgi:hypothetical protein
MMRWNETWHRLKDWADGQAKSEALAAHILAADGFKELDPSHPRGGPDEGKDAVAIFRGKTWIMAVYFPSRDCTFREIKAKFISDYKGIAKHDAKGMAFVTNQVLTLGERQELDQAVTSPVQIYHRDRIALILDKPEMSSIRHQFLGIPSTPTPNLKRVWDDDMRGRLSVALRDGAGPSAYMRGTLVRRAAEPMLADSPLAPIDFQVAEIDGADVWTFCAAWSPRPVYMWLYIRSKGRGSVTVAANERSAYDKPTLPYTDKVYEFTTDDGALEAVEDAVNWGLMLLANERHA